MAKIKEIKTRNVRRKARITVKSLLNEVRKKANAKQVEKVTELLEERYSELTAAKKLVKKMEKQIKIFENKDINEIDVDEYEYNEDEE